MRYGGDRVGSGYRLAARYQALNARPGPPGGLSGQPERETSIEVPSPILDLAPLPAATGNGNRRTNRLSLTLLFDLLGRWAKPRGQSVPNVLDS